jgi:hypothetical protein
MRRGALSWVAMVAAMYAAVIIMRTVKLEGAHER